jgi:hypothetical protein
MKSLLFLPFAYVADVYGFAFFAPYLVLVVGTMHLVRSRRRARAVEAIAR